MAVSLPIIKLLPKRDGRAKAGHPWVFANEVAMDAAAKAIPAGQPVCIEDSQGNPLGTYGWNASSLIVARKWSGSPNAMLDHKWFEERLRHALARRTRLFIAPFYRLVHSEGDDLPGIVIDRFGDAAVIQLTTAAAEAVKQPLQEALASVVGITHFVWRKDTAARTLEGLEMNHIPEITTTKAGPSIDGTTWLTENGLAFAANILGGQKTGWFYDQRANRAHVAQLAKGQRVADIFCHTGGFGLHAATGGATEVLFIDRDAEALEIAGQSAERQNMADKCAQLHGDAFHHIERLAQAGERFGVVVCDPPAFIKNAKTIAQGLKGYEKLARMAAGLVRGGGYLVLNSCSHHAATEAFTKACIDGVRKGGRSGRVIRLAGADVDHPQHMLMAENTYLKCLTLQLD